MPEEESDLKFYLVKRADTADFDQCETTVVWAENEDRADVLAGYEQGYIDVIETGWQVPASACLCGTTYETYAGPEPDCPVHGTAGVLAKARAALDEDGMT